MQLDGSTAIIHDTIHVFDTPTENYATSADCLIVLLLLLLLLLVWYTVLLLIFSSSL